MGNIENFIESPGDKDILVSDVFTPAMFDELEGHMKEAGWANIREYWENDYSKRHIVSEFMTDGELGSKRLMSMPDRVTNTINVENNEEPVCRPAVINMYDGDLSSVNLWWKQWTKFMFSDPLLIKTSGGNIEQKPYEMLKPISKSKYPAITEVSLNMLSHYLAIERFQIVIQDLIIFAYRTRKKIHFHYRLYVEQFMILSSFI